MYNPSVHRYQHDDRRHYDQAEQQVNINRDIGSFHILLTMDLTPGSIFCHFFAKIEDCFENPIILLVRHHIFAVRHYIFILLFDNS